MHHLTRANVTYVLGVAGVVWALVTMAGLEFVVAFIGVALSPQVWKHVENGSKEIKK